MLYTYIARYYDLMDFPFEKSIYQNLRKKWISKISNEKILEIGVGTGKNLFYYSSSNVVLGIDTNYNMIKRASLRLKRKKLNKTNIRLKFIKKFPDKKIFVEDFTYIIATFVFCTLPDPNEILDKISSSVLPNTKILLFEWVLPKNGLYHWFLKLISPLTTLIFGVNFYRRPTVAYLNNNWKKLKITKIKSYIYVAEFAKI